MKKEEVAKKRTEPCKCCGLIDENGNHIIGYDKTDVDGILEQYWKKGDSLCAECLFK